FQLGRIHNARSVNDLRRPDPPAVKDNLRASGPFVGAFGRFRLGFQKSAGCLGRAIAKAWDAANVGRTAAARCANNYRVLAGHGGGSTYGREEIGREERGMETGSRATTQNRV